MTRDQFVAKYRYRWGGMVLFGTATDDPQQGVLSRTQRVMAAPVEIDKLLAVMYDDLRAATLAEAGPLAEKAEPPRPGPAPKK